MKKKFFKISNNFFIQRITYDFVMFLNKICYFNTKLEKSAVFEEILPPKF